MKLNLKLNAKSLYAGFFGVVGFFVALSLAWVVMMKCNFFYGVWHDYAGIKEGLEKYAPQNRYKPGFLDTTREQRVSLFYQINQAIHRGGEGLAEIRYQTPTSRGVQILLREPEVIHLQDVANLLDVLMWGVIAAIILWLGIGLRYYFTHRCFPVLLHQLYGLGALLLCLVCVLIVFGPENVFNTLHIWIFPDEHEWFFFYQDSLMSTMMFAPYLFGWIAAAWVVLSIVIFVGIAFALKKGAEIINNKAKS